MKNLKKLSRTELKNTLGGKLQTGVPQEGFACYCDGNFRGYVFSAAACIYTCDYRP